MNQTEKRVSYRRISERRRIRRAGKMIRRYAVSALLLAVITASIFISGAFLEMVIAMATVFNLADEDIYDAIINQSEELAHICDIYRLKLAA